jgi:nicotinamidase-related amidase
VNEVKLAFGKQIPTTLEELVDPQRTALLIVDVQNDYAKENGKLLFPEMVRSLRNVIDEARRVGVLIIYIQDTLLPGRLSDSATSIRRYMVSYGKSNPEDIPSTAVEGTYGQEFVDEIRPLKSDVIVKKFRGSGFVGTGLDLLLRSNDIRNVIITGMDTHGCVESTRRTAIDYHIVVLRDCVNTKNQELHEACLKLMEHGCDLVTSGQVIDIWKKHKPS